MKAIKLVATLALVFSLAGCMGNDVQEGNNNNQENLQINESVQSENENNVEINNDVIIPLEGQEESDRVSMGSWSENVYTNDFLNLKYTLPEGWRKFSEEEINGLMGIGNDLAFGDDEYLKSIAELTAIYYMAAQNETNGNNVFVITEKPLTSVTLDEYIASLKTQLETIDVFNYEVGEASTEKIGDKELKAITAKVPEYNLVQKYYVYEVGEYIAGIVVASTTGDEGITEIINCFE